MNSQSSPAAAGGQGAQGAAAGGQESKKLFSFKQMVSTVLLAFVPLGVGELSHSYWDEKATSKEVRAFKSPIYVEMVESSYGYGRAQAVAHECEIASSADCPVSPDDLEQARSRFENAQAQVFMFGSPAAMSAVTDMRKAGLVPNLSPNGQAKVQEVDLDKLLAANMRFQLAVCEEARADECKSR